MAYPDIQPNWHPFHVAGHVGYMEGKDERCHFYHRTVWAVDRHAAETSERERLEVAYPEALHINLLINPVSDDELAALVRYGARRHGVIEAIINNLEPNQGVQGIFNTPIHIGKK